MPSPAVQWLLDSDEPGASPAATCSGEPVRRHSADRTR